MSEWKISEGMSLRDYFAAKAMQALLSNPGTDMRSFRDDFVAESAYIQADAMLKEREKTK